MLGEFDLGEILRDLYAVRIAFYGRFSGQKPYMLIARSLPEDLDGGSDDAEDTA